MVGETARDVLFKFYVTNKFKMEDLPSGKIKSFFERTNIQEYYEDNKVRFEPDKEGNLKEILIYCNDAKFKVRDIHHDKKYEEIMNRFVPIFIRFFVSIGIMTTWDFKLDLMPDITNKNDAFERYFYPSEKKPENP